MWCYWFNLGAQAPTVKKRIPSHARVSRRSAKRPSHSTTNYPSNDDTFKSTKEDKRRIKHSTLISRIEKANTRVKKRRRPSKKLIANLESLVDALPEAGSAGPNEVAVGDAWIRQRSLKSKPGALKKKDKLEKLEMERFSKNMAQMAHVTGDGSRHGPRADALEVKGRATDGSQRWAALRGFIQSTMDRGVTNKAS
ncbi:hypothetical protein MMC27_001382 [Xylographa pallens]|nr:hypothetical protein [Xylographa pallens]